MQPATRFGVFVRDTIDFALLRRGIWLTLRCGDDGTRWKLRIPSQGFKIVGDEQLVALALSQHLGLDVDLPAFWQAYPQVWCSLDVTRLTIGDTRYTLASWLTQGRHGMWVTSKPRQGPNKYAACMRDLWHRAYVAAFSPEECLAHDFSPLIRDPHHPLCQYHRMVTLEMAIAEHSDSVEGSGDP